MAFYSCGDDVTIDEIYKSLDRMGITSDKEIGRRMRRLSPLDILALMNAHARNRFEHEVNRQRGLSFDVGEAGFSYVRGGWADA